MPKLDLDSIAPSNRTGYPAPFAGAMTKRWSRRLGAVAALEDFGISHVTLDPGGISSQRHWHEAEDEVVIMLVGEAVLIEDGEETKLRAGEIAAFPKGVANGHHLVNRSDQSCVFVAIGRTAASDCHYPDVDLRLDGASGRFTRKDGTAY